MIRLLYQSYVQLEPIKQLLGDALRAFVRLKQVRDIAHIEIQFGEAQTTSAGGRTGRNGLFAAIE